MRLRSLAPHVNFSVDSALPWKMEEFFPGAGKAVADISGMHCGGQG